MRTVLLYGHLGTRFGRRHRFAVSTPAEAFRALRANFPEFERQVLQHKGGYHILVGFEDRYANSVEDPCGKSEVIRIVPSHSGAGVVEGVALVIGAMLEGMVGSAVAAWIGMAVANTLVSMVLSGIAQALFAPDKPNVNSTERPVNTPSDTFNGPVNTMAQGHPVPVGYGRLRVGSQVISAGMSVEQIAI